MKTSILIVTHAKDKEWLEPCLKSIFKFCSGFHEVVVALPNRDKAELFPILTRYPVKSWGFDEVEGHGFNHHQAVICMADQICEDADLILHVDVDCMFVEPVTLQDYIINDKPVLLIENYERFRTVHPGVFYWKQCTEKALGMPCTYETMRRHPAVHWKETYCKTREMVESAHKKPFLQYMLEQKDSFPQTVSEFNMLGSVAAHFYKDRYHIIDLEHQARPKDKLIQFWSHGGLNYICDKNHWLVKNRTVTARQVAIELG